MKMKFLAFVALAASLAVVSCKGDKGELGPQGPAGPQGPQGPGVIYSNWTDINMVPIDFSSPDRPADENDLNGIWGMKQVIAAPKVTADVLNKGVVLGFIKNSEGTVTSVEGGIYTVSDKYDTDGDGDLDIFLDHAKMTRKEGQVKLLGAIHAHDQNGNPISYLNLSGATFRYVVIPGVEAGRAADLQKMSYREVAKKYSLKD